VITYFISFAFFYVRRKCYVVFACCRVLVVRAVICSWFETTCESMWLALCMYSRLCVYYFCLHSNKIGSAVQCSAVQYSLSKEQVLLLNWRHWTPEGYEERPWRDDFTFWECLFLEPIACWV